ncbi:MAG: hypothetical protein HYS81_03730 [Candidatus Aenigmatarchaeota archaeon]|nr:MAG: hypothetical protein HYS81_03730 [Candidatus Aenigmarchaeota archaeon]
MGLFGGSKTSAEDALRDALRKVCTELPAMSKVLGIGEKNARFLKEEVEKGATQNLTWSTAQTLADSLENEATRLDELSKTLRDAAKKPA